jgi:hypothetical protein
MVLRYFSRGFKAPDSLGERALPLKRCLISILADNLGS